MRIENIAMEIASNFEEASERAIAFKITLSALKALRMLRKEYDLKRDLSKNGLRSILAQIIEVEETNIREEIRKAETIEMLKDSISLYTSAFDSFIGGM